MIKWNGHPLTIHVDVQHLGRKRSVGAHFDIRASDQGQAEERIERILRQQFRKIADLPHTTRLSLAREL